MSDDVCYPDSGVGSGLRKFFFVGDTVPNRRFGIGRSLKEVCRGHAVRVFNLEGAIPGQGKPLLKAGSHLALERRLFAPLADCFSVAVLANNHAMDFGVEGLEATIEHCRRLGVSTVGAGANLTEAFRPLDFGNCRIVAVAENEFGAAGEDRPGIATVDRPGELYSVIRQGREADKFVIVVGHGGTERIPLPPPYLRQRYKLWIEWGADLVIGNHPHVVQGYEKHNGKAIFYSLGNFAFLGDTGGDSTAAPWSIAVSVDIAEHDVNVIPLSVGPDGVIDTDPDKRRSEEIERLCGLIRSEGYEAEYRQIAERLYESWYPRLKTGTPEDAALLLHYLRCDAHRNLVQTALSRKIGEIPAASRGHDGSRRDVTEAAERPVGADRPGADLGDETENWFSHSKVWDGLLGRFRGRDNLRFLELGSWKGRSALWLAENILTGRDSKVFCVDVWDVSQWNRQAEETQALLRNPERARQMRVGSLYETFISNTEHLRDRIVPIKKKTVDALAQFIEASERFDFIYIDADHSEESVFEDFRLSCRCLKPAGVIFLDDLSWNSVRRAVKRIREELGVELVEADSNGAYYLKASEDATDGVPVPGQGAATTAPGAVHSACRSRVSQPLAIRTMDGRELSLPELPGENASAHQPRPKVEDIMRDIGKWADPRLAYLASADQWLGFEAFFRKNHLMQCDVFYCVIGGLGGLNLLARLNPLKKIVFYDANIYSALILDMQLQLIRNSSSVDEYISLIYQRPFHSDGYDFHNQSEFLKAPMDARYTRSIEESLTPQAYRTYSHFYLPYISRQPVPVYDGPTVCCTHLLPFFESSALTDPLVSGLEEGSVNINTFYVGKGWLGSEETFGTVRRHLLESEIEVLIGDVSEIRPAGGFCGIYTTNIYNTLHRAGYRKFGGRCAWIVGYDDSTDWEVKYYPNGVSEGAVEYERLVGAGNCNTHATCCEAIDDLLDLNGNDFLEIIEPPPSEGMNYGFRFYRGQKPILVDDYLKGDFGREQIIVLHILLGGGTAQAAWRQVCRKAVSEAKRYVMIFEHRKECGDWPQHDVHYDNLLNHDQLDRFIYSLDRRWTKRGIANVKGDVGDVRNIMYFLDKARRAGMNRVEAGPGAEIGHQRVADGQRRPGRVSDAISGDRAVPAASEDGWKQGEAEIEELFERGVGSLTEGRDMEALNCFERAIEMNPEMPHLHFARATACVKLGALGMGAEACKAELARRPGHEGAGKLLGKIQRALAEQDLADERPSAIPSQRKPDRGENTS